jgi:hypothetical protein
MVHDSQLVLDAFWHIQTSRKTLEQMWQAKNDGNHVVHRS